ncbi:site-specific integrase [Pedobacter xixiisoli]|uniref:Site-specific recombinase XerD n=1 Tax=Pedobacter xixiisoli TaxID=1476464 RepID=A0A286A7H2_9SPHI|nr:site-specific integrase [Pedobacter xixiisoli]SOD17817.1 Site-specific recombinase XerD [Pedobacter xixiisoli]
MSQNYSLHFFLKKPKNYINGPKFVYMRITVNNSITKEASVGRMCDPKDWISSANRVKGTSESARTLNSYLDAINRKVEQVHTNLKKMDMQITADTIMNMYLGKEEKPKSLMQIFADHNKKMEASIGKGFKANTLKGYKSSVIHLTAYLEKDYKTSDVDIRKIDHAFITGYEFYLRTEKEISDVSVAKYMKHFRKIVNLSLAHRWIEYNPFVFYKNKAKAKDKEFLSKDELSGIADKEFGIERLDRVKDIFLFSCYTGLSYADVKKLTRSEVKIGNDGKLWIFTNREKNEIASKVPLLAIPKKLMDKYEDHPSCRLKGMVLPVLSNQKMNSYLKEIADHCGIKKKLTFHIARHTFATTVTLSNNVPIETVSKMLGHRDLKTTQHYAKVLDAKVGSDMAELEEKLR